jgi:NO-binding membrane sensor protein with MHYT domain
MEVINAKVDPSLCVWGPDGVIMVFTWDFRLIALSVAIAVIGSFAALECAERMRLAVTSGPRLRFSYLGAGLMGLAIWTMHFVGMLALKMPMPVSYVPSWSILSIIAAAVGAGLAFFIMNRPKLTAFHVAMGGVAMGVAIASMHYIGMKSMHMSATIDYEPKGFILSIVIAMSASAGALAIGYSIPKNPRWAFWMKAGSALVMGAAISGMHYVGMAAARYRAIAIDAGTGADPMVGSFRLQDVVSVAGVVFGGALIALASRSAVERQRALDAHRQLAAELEERVKRRTAELEAMNRELSAFSYTVSHDLRSPLRTITGFSEVLLEANTRALDETSREHVERIHSAAGRMNELLEGLLNMAHISRAKMERVDVDLSELARTIISDFTVQESKRKVDVVIAEGMRASGDRTLLSSVLQNLLSNAWKFSAMSTAGRIEFGSREPGGPTVYYVQDNGAGFNMAHSEKLFGMFERLHTAAEFPGNGIGLAVTKRIVERHGGKIWAESALGEGATFFFTLC